MMPSSRKGRGQKKITRVPVPIPESLAEKLRRASNGKETDAPLLTKPSGERWKQSDHSRVARIVVQRWVLLAATSGKVAHRIDRRRYQVRVCRYCCRSSVTTYAERLIGTLRRECLDHVLIFGARHLRRLLASYSHYHNETRTYLSLTNPQLSGPTARGRVVHHCHARI